MENGYKYYLLLFIILFSINLISAESAFTLTQNQDTNITITVYNTDNSLSTIASTCTITIRDKDQLVRADSSSMSFSGNGKFTLYVGDIIDKLGTYSADLNCFDGTSEYLATTFQFEVTPKGDNLKTSNSLLYIFVLLINLALLVFFIYAGIITDGRNQSNEDGLIEVIHKKYVKMGCLFMAYALSIWFFFNMYEISSSYLNLDFMSKFFNAIFHFLLSAIIPVIFAFVIFILYWVVKDSKLKEMFESGLSPNPYG